MLSRIINKVKIHFKSQKQEQELRELFKLDYRLEKELAASKLD